MREVWLVSAISITFVVLGCTQPPPAIQPQTPKAPPVAAKVEEKPTLAQVITELEKFLERPDLTPPMRAQALFRLATLKEDQARQEPNDSNVLNLRPSIELYQTIVREHKDQEFVPSIYYFLGHALVDSGRVAEGQQVFRALVCRNHFTYVPASDSKAPVAVQRLPQDHEANFWTAWETRHPRPRSGAAKSGAASSSDEMVFVNPYPADCTAMEEKPGSSQTLRFLGEVWWRIGDYHFDQIDPWGGPYNLNRAAAAYTHALQHGTPQIRGLARYKLGWTFFKQQRYAAAVDQFVSLLRNADIEKVPNGNRAIDLRKEACTYIAAALTYTDFQGPGPDDPFIVREDVLDTEKDPRIAEKKMRIGIERVRYGKIVPQDEPWTSDIYAALVDEYRELMQLNNMIELGEIFLAKWPNHARAGEIRQTLDANRNRVGKP